ncbi:mitochondrial 39-S ribosomal protein L47 (MRP-L47)-domain-containing protein [Mycena rebaudengoi]|nr:mitochondrial 39-S ribosomal protein L47 (MRP-L47)-domain-containing protein [Mycena rebaudengoi]
MLSSALRITHRLAPRCMRPFSFTAHPSASEALLVGAPANHQPDLSYTTNVATSSAPVLRIGSGRRRRTAPPPSEMPAFLPPTAPDLSMEHGLYGFFRVKADPGLEGQERFETFADPTQAQTGRSWLASELRRKSFKDLHVLWYVLLRERNLLATQREEMRRLGVMSERVSNRPASARCRKSMARIKAVMNERRLAYDGAVVLAEKERESAMDKEVLDFKIKVETTAVQKLVAKARRKRVEAVWAKRATPTLKVKERVVAVKAAIKEAAPSLEKKSRWTKAQKAANEAYKQRAAAEGRSLKRPKRRLLQTM